MWTRQGSILEILVVHRKGGSFYVNFSRKSMKNLQQRLKVSGLILTNTSLAVTGCEGSHLQAEKAARRQTLRA